MIDPARTALVTDFDGTAVIHDVGDRIAERFVEGGAALLARLNAEAAAGRLTLIELQEQVWPLVRASPEELYALIDEVAVPRADFVAVTSALLEQGGRVVVASGGFDLYIERALARALGPALAARVEVHANRLRAGGPGGAVEASFPLREALGCPRCALCKGRVLDRVRAAGFRAVFAGDGLSDRCALGRADEVFCVAGSSLERGARERGAPHTSFVSYAALAAALGLAPPNAVS